MVADSILILARPKSHSLAVPEGGGAVRRTFLLFKSLCMMLME